MIKINLLPPELQGKKVRAKAAVAAPSAIAPGLAIGLVAAFFLVLWAVVGYTVIWKRASGAKSERLEVQNAFDKAKALLDKEQEAHKEKLAEWNLLRNQKEILEVLMPEKRLLWSEKLNMLADLRPEGVYLTGAQVIEDREMVETRQSAIARADWARKKAAFDAKEISEDPGEEPKRIEKPLIKQTLVLNAVGTGELPTDRFDKVVEFERALQGHESAGPKGDKRRFMDFFQNEIQLGVMEERRQDGILVWAFEFRLTTLPVYRDEG
ncbi:MAG TPA: hypothetical protein VM492_07960 [Sumerlaeia bacterium]|nr:hypothetical protein [Sumerlaeia bacterium]